MVLNPVSGTNITGVILSIPPAVKLEMLQKILPERKKIGLIYSKKTGEMAKDISLVCAKKKLQLFAEELKKQEDFLACVEKLQKDIDCFWMLSDPDIFSPQSTKYILMKGIKEKMPVIGISFVYVKAGALFALDCDYEDIGRQSAELALKILTDAKKGIPSFEFPRKADLSLNLIVAKEIGIEIPEKIVKDAKEVVKQ